MKILQVCNKIPYPSKDGGSIAIHILTEGLLTLGHQVTVLTINTPKHFLKEEEIDVSYRAQTSFRSVFVDTSVKPLDAFLNLFSSASYNVIRFYSKGFERALNDLLRTGDFDIIELETLWVTPYVETIRKNTRAKIVLRSQNVEFRIWERMAEQAKNPLKKWYLKLLARRLKKYEIGMLNKYDGIACITDLDASSFKELGCTVPVITIPFGVNSATYQIEKTEPEYPSLFHIGSMDWLPNEEAIKWFLNHVWETIHQKYPTLNLYLAGRNMPVWLSNLKMNNVIVVGEVDDSSKFINSKSIMVVPLQSGGGMRVKIIEGMALGKTIISTSIGAEGIACKDNHDILIANSATEFGNAVDKCVADKSFCERLGRNARLLIENEYDNQKICNRLSEFYKTLS